MCREKKKKKDLHMVFIDLKKPMIGILNIYYDEF